VDELEEALTSARRKTPMATRKARIKPSGQTPPGPLGNAPGVIVPKTEPNLSGSSSAPPIRTETAEESSLLQKAAGLLEKGEIKRLNDAKGWVQGGVDQGVQALGGGALASGAGVVIKGAVEVFFPTNIIDFVPFGKVASAGGKGVKLGEKLVKNTAEKTAREAAEKAAKETAERQTAQAAAKHGKQAGGSGGAYGKGKQQKKSKDPCKHPRDAKKKKYVVYKADEFDANGNKIGTYVGRTSGAPDESTRSILKRRRSNHHRKGLGTLEELFETDSYAGVRGAEQILKDQHSTSKQTEPISDRNKRKQDYLDCAQSKGAK